MFQRFILKYISERYGRGNYYVNPKGQAQAIDPSDDEDVAKEMLMRALIYAAGGKLKEYDPSDSQFLTKLVEICESIAQNFKDTKDNKCVALLLQIHSNNWQNNKYLAALEWLATELYPLSAPKKAAVDFLFFISVKYNNVENLDKPKGFFNIKRIFGAKDPFEEIRKELKTIPNISPIASALPELAPVPKSDIVAWLDFVQLKEEAKLIILEKEFDNEETISMQNVETTLDKIIQLHNNEKLQAWIENGCKMPSKRD